MLTGLHSVATVAEVQAAKAGKPDNTIGEAGGWPVEVFREFSFAAAHYLPAVPDGHKCARMHGHTYTVTLSVRGTVDSRRGWVTDFADITAAFQPVHDQLDHRCLNEVRGLDNPTCENLAAWIWRQCDDRLPGLFAVSVQETPRSGCTLRRTDLIDPDDEMRGEQASGGRGGA